MTESEEEIAEDGLDSEMQCIVVLGAARSGKSALCRMVTGLEDGSDGGEFVGSFGGFSTFLVDTSGLDYDNDIQAQHIVDLVESLSAVIRAFVIVLNSEAPEFGDSLSKIFELIWSIYPDSRWSRNVCVVWSRCPAGASGGPVLQRKQQFM